ncbi:MAG: tRNA pseudouridine(38-40) synthase TruA, partial [Dysgonamonadaceae bacterium]|nr:tRNA pseudouridine(38-40) synthase TruA [Dysgonamonadaceae bacterium]
VGSTEAGELVEPLNRILPPDITVRKIIRVSPGAHARFDAVSRTYQYYISFRKDPFDYPFRYRLNRLPDFDRMNEAAAVLFEYADFTSFSKLHTDVKTNLCRIIRAGWTQTGDVGIFTITADRFLRNMVRAVVGTLLDVGRGKLSIKGFRDIIESKDRCKAGASVPGNALFLTDIEYPPGIFLPAREPG